MGAKCNSCGKLNHYSTVCRSRDDQRHERGPQSYRHNASESERVNFNTKSEKSSSNRHASHQTQATGIKQVGFAENSSHSVDDEEYAEFLRYKKNVGYGLFAVGKSASVHCGKVSRINEGPKVNIELLGSSLGCLVDTGSPINVIDEKSFTSLKVRPRLEACNTKYFGYNASTPLPILGQFTTNVSFNGKQINAGFIVIEGSEECLMSFKTASQLGIIQINSNKCPSI